MSGRGCVRGLSRLPAMSLQRLVWSRLCSAWRIVRQSWIDVSKVEWNGLRATIATIVTVITGVLTSGSSGKVEIGIRIWESLVPCALLVILPIRHVTSGRGSIGMVDRLIYLGWLGVSRKEEVGYLSAWRLEVYIVGQGSSLESRIW